MFYEYFEKLIDPLAERPVEQAPSDTSGFFRYHIMPYRGVILAALLLSGVAAVSELLIYRFLGSILDWMAAGARTDFLSTHALPLLVMLIIAAVVRPVSFVVSRAYLNLALAPGLANACRWRSHRYVLRQSLSFFQNDFAGRVSQKVLQTGHALREAVFNVIDGLWLLVIYLVGIVILFVEIQAVLLVPVLLWSLAYAAVIRFMVPPVRAKSAALSESNSTLSGRIVDSYTNIQSVKLFAHAEQEERFSAEAFEDHTFRFRVLMRAILSMTTVMTIMNTALIVGVAWLCLLLWLQQRISVGEIAVANGLILRLNQMSGWILRTITSLFENIGTVQNGVATISRPNPVVDVLDAEPIQVASGEIAFENVRFNYGVEQCVIDHFNLRIKPGEKVGLVGRSGAGKSTLVNLLLRFHELEAGCIRIDGQDISLVTQNSLRSSIAVVTQDTSLLHRSIRDNVRYGKPAATDQQVLEALTRSEAMSFIDSLGDPAGRQGLDAHVGERGVKLSGGQRQRIAIARVILKNAPILVLDEATSALDSEVEAAIQSKLNALMQGKTVIAVAHRLSTIAALDRLVVLDQGRIIEQGSHTELLAQNGLYAGLWARQSGGFLALS